MRHYVLLAVLCTGLAQPARAADGFVSAGLGAGSGGLGWNLSGKLVAGRLLFGLRLAAVEEFEILGPAPPESVKDYGLLVGLASRQGNLLQYGAVGVGVARSVHRGQVIGSGLFGPRHERLEDTAVGVPLEAGVVLHGRHFGIGVSLFGNLNRAESFFGVSLTLHVGAIP